MYKSKVFKIMEAYLKVDKVSKIFKVKPVTIRRWCKSGIFKARKIGKSWYIPKSELALPGDKEIIHKNG